MKDFSLIFFFHIKILRIDWQCDLYPSSENEIGDWSSTPGYGCFLIFVFIFLGERYESIPFQAMGKIIK